MTLAELAALANVSHSTASKAFSNSEDISAETREHVFKIAREHHCYEKFHKGKYFKKLIAVICPEIKSEAYHRVVTHLETLIAEMGATMVLSLSKFDSLTEETLFYYHAYYQKVDGIIIIGQYGQLKYDPDIPVVMLEKFPQEKFTTVWANNISGIDAGVKHLLDMGHRKIAFLGETLTLGILKSLREVMKKYALALPDEYIFISDERFEVAGYKCMEKLLALKDRPTAVFISYDYMALGAIKCLKDHGLSVPEDMSIIARNDLRILPYISPAITSINERAEEKCKIALDILKKKMDNKYYAENQAFELEQTLTIRESVKNIKDTNGAVGK